MLQGLIQPERLRKEGTVMAADLLELFRSAVRMIEDGVATGGIALPGGITTEQLAAAARQRGRDARKLAALWIELSRRAGG